MSNHRWEEFVMMLGIIFAIWAAFKIRSLNKK